MASPTTKSLNDDEIRRRGSKFDMEVREEASYVLWYVWQGLRAGYSNLQPCTGALMEDDGLYRALKVAHAQGKYDRIRFWQKTTIAPSPISDALIEEDVKLFLEQLKPTMKKLVVGDIILPVWTPPDELVDAETLVHLTSLRIPCLKGKPNLLLHDLGSFTRDPVLEKRLKNIFMPNNHTFLVNTSGSGKTRLLLEGLCGNWGFYFTSLVDSSLLGSSDIQNSIQTRVPDSAKFRHVLPPSGSAGYDAALQVNREIANRIFRQIFLARLMIFNLFTETMKCYIKLDEDPRIYRQRWLLLQLLPSFVHPQAWDVFDELSCKLSDATDIFINSTTKALLNNVRILCSELQHSNIYSTTTQLSTAETAQTPLFCILDEAQYAATKLSSSFRSDQNGTHRPILREIVKAWEGQSFGRGVFMVVAGTGISKGVVDQAMASAIMKDSRYRWCSDTGAFDCIKVQRMYLQKYLPQNLLESDAGLRLQERVWYWLHGRHRFTSGYVAELLLNGFKRPHGLLNAYIEHFTSFKVTDAHLFVKSEGLDALPVFSQYKLDFSKLKKNGDMLATIHQLTTHYLMRSVLPLTLGKDEATYVEYGFARFVDSDTKKVVVDEPLVLLSATHWTNTKHIPSYKFFAKQIPLHEINSNGFENYTAFCIDLIFSRQRALKDVFTFIGIPPSWANLHAELVALYRTNLNVTEESPVRYSSFSTPSITLGTNAKTPQETSSWLEHGTHSPICFPHTAMGPDLIFILRLSDGTLIWVVLQAKYSQGRSGYLTRPFLRQAIRSVTPSSFFLDKEGNPFSPTSHPDLVEDTRRTLSELPNRRTDAGRYSLLRVIASFPADTHLKRCLEEDPDVEGHPIASLNMTLVKDLTRKLSPIDYLHKLEEPLQNSVKRKRGTLDLKKPKRHKLNLN